MKKEKEVLERENLERIRTFVNTPLVNEKKTESILIRVSPTQKEIIKKMAKVRKISVAEMILNLLQYEKDNNILLNKVLEKD